MSELKILVPDNDCKGCDFLSHSCIETSYQCYQEKDICMIFRTEIKNKQKCMACRMNTRQEGEK